MDAAALSDRAVLETKHRGLLMLAVIAVTLCQFFDATIANVALPHMRSALGASTESISWVMTSFIIATGIATPITGWLSDRMGSRNLFMGATALFLLASAACGAATSLEAMIVFRIVQGIAAAFIGPMSQTLLFDISPPSKQGSAMAVFGLIVMVAPITGPMLGGWLTEYLNWRWIYYVNLPIGIPALAILWFLLPSRPIDRRKLDITGYLALALGLGAMQLVLDRGQHQDWFRSREIVAETIVAISAFWIFFVHTLHVKEPLFRREIFSNKPFLFAALFMMIIGISVIGLSAVLPMLFQSLYGYGVVDSGAMMAPRGLGVMITSLLANHLIKKYDYRWVICCGFLIASAGMWSMTRWTLVMDVNLIYLAIFVQGMGMGLIVMPMNFMAFSTLAPYLRPDGSSLMSLFRSLGGSVGISVLVTVMGRMQQVNHAEIGANITDQSVPGIDLPALADRFPSLGTGVMAVIDGEVNRQAMMIAFLDSFVMLFWMLLLFAPMVFLLKRAKAGPPSGQPMMSE